MLWKFLIAGSATLGEDGRQVILLTPSERQVVLGEMRAFLESVQAILQGVQQQDMAQVAEAARRVGAAAQQGMPGGLMGKLPMEFKQLGLDTHRRFDQLAMNAEDLGDAAVVLEELVELMNNCVGCHGVYRIDPETP